MNVPRKASSPVRAVYVLADSQLIFVRAGVEQPEINAQEATSQYMGWGPR
jgi:hypothetical protein